MENSKTNIEIIREEITQRLESGEPMESIREDLKARKIYLFDFFNEEIETEEIKNDPTYKTRFKDAWPYLTVGFLMMFFTKRIFFIDTDLLKGIGSFMILIFVTGFLAFCLGLYTLMVKSSK